MGQTIYLIWTNLKHSKMFNNEQFSVQCNVCDTYWGTVLIWPTPAWCHMECARANVYENLFSRRESCVAAKLNNWNGVLRYFHWVSCGDVITSTRRSCRTDQYESGKAAIMSPTELIHMWIWFEGITVYLKWSIFRLFPKQWWSKSFYKTQMPPATILQYSHHTTIQLISEDTQPYVSLFASSVIQTAIIAAFTSMNYYLQ